MLVDWPLEQLRRYDPRPPLPGDAAAFWADALADRGSEPVAAAELTAVEHGIAAVETFDVAFTGFGGQRVRAWLHLPAASWRPDGELPGVVQYQGYGGGRGAPHEFVLWALAGYAHLVVDTRGQGSGYATGATGDAAGTAGPSGGGWLTQGLDDPRHLYYRRAHADAVHAFDVLAGHELVDADRVAVTGASQGGGLAIAVAALRSGRVAAAMPDVPFLCDVRRAVDVAASDPYLELVRYLAAHRDRVEQAFTALAYVDGAALAAWATAPALYSVALRDAICPPSTVFAAAHAHAGPAELEVYAFNGHEGGGVHQQARQLAWLAERLGPCV